jgi:hypothetical protein
MALNTLILPQRESLGDCFLQFLLLQHQGFFFFGGLYFATAPLKHRQFIDRH